MLDVCILFSLAYICLIAAVCGTLKAGTQQIERDYPLTEWKQPDAPLTAE